MLWAPWPFRFCAVRGQCALDVWRQATATTTTHTLSAPFASPLPRPPPLAPSSTPTATYLPTRTHLPFPHHHPACLLLRPPTPSYVLVRCLVSHSLVVARCLSPALPLVLSLSLTLALSMRSFLRACSPSCSRPSVCPSFLRPPRAPHRVLVSHSVIFPRDHPPTPSFLFPPLYARGLFVGQAGVWSGGNLVLRSRSLSWLPSLRRSCLSVSLLSVARSSRSPVVLPFYMFRWFVELAVSRVSSRVACPSESPARACYSVGLPWFSSDRDLVSCRGRVRSVSRLLSVAGNKSSSLVSRVAMLLQLLVPQRAFLTRVANSSGLVAAFGRCAVWHRRRASCCAGRRDSGVMVGGVAWARARARW
jgi:hypothetical protein